jgi:hypothetical protein
MRSINCRRLGPLVGVLLLGVNVAAAQNLLTNPSFEDPLTSDGPPFVGFWESFSGDGDQFNGPDVARNSTLMPRTGLQSVELAIVDTPNTFAGLFQDVPGLVPGDLVSYSGWHKSLGDSSAIEIRIEWRDSVNDTEISRTPNFVPSPGDVYELFTLSDAVPAGADTARVVYAIQSFSGVTSQQVFLEDFMVVPEPASVLLLSLAGLALLRRR